MRVKGIAGARFLVAICLLLPACCTPSKKTTDAEPESRGAAERVVEFRSGEHVLRGMLHLPEDVPDRGAPAVLFLHGYTADRIGPHYLFVRASRSLAEAGIASLRFDFAGSGESEGRFRDASLVTELADARVALDFLCRQRGIDPDRIATGGGSSGGTVAWPPRTGGSGYWHAVPGSRRSWSRS